MTSVLVAYDDQDDVLGEYFDECKQDFEEFYNDNKIPKFKDPVFIPSNRCNQAYIDIELDKINGSNFVFLAYSHGNEKALRCQGNSYVEKGTNTVKLSNSLFYCNSCLSGKELGQDLIDNGCHSFIGYDEEVDAFLFDDYKIVSINCDNSGIKSFFSDDITIGEAFSRMKSYYNTKIDKYKEIDPIFASQLVNNRESLIFLGDESITKKSLENS